MTIFRFIPTGGGGAGVLAGDAVGPAAANVVEGIQTRPVDPAAPGVGQIYIWDGAQWTPSNLSGDVTGPATATVVEGLQTRPVDAAAPGAGEVLTWDGAQWTPSPVPSSSPQIDEISGLSNTRHYTLAVDPTSALTQFTVAVLARIGLDSAAVAPRYGIGTRNAADGGGGGGWGIRFNGFGDSSRPNRIQVIAIDNGGNQRLVDYASITNGEKLTLVMLRFDGNEGGNTRLSMVVNGIYIGDVFGAGVFGPPTVGGTFTVGATNGGATGEGIGTGWLHGAAYVDRLLSFSEIVAVTEASLAALELQDIPSGGSWSAAWRVAGGDPGTPWAPFVGGGNLTRTGTAPTYAVRNNPMVW